MWCEWVSESFSPTEGEEREGEEREGEGEGSSRGFFFVRSSFIVCSIERWSLLLALGTVCVHVRE